MATKVVAGTAVQFNGEGLMTDPNERRRGIVDRLYYCIDV